MSSGQPSLILISASAGVAIGLIDSVGFFATARIFFARSLPQRFLISGLLEAGRLAILVAVIIFLALKSPLPFWWMIIPALLISCAGKFFVTLKRLGA